MGKRLWGLDGVGSGQGQVAGACEYGDELSGSIKYGEFLDYLQNQLAYQEGLCSMEYKNNLIRNKNKMNALKSMHAQPRQSQRRILIRQ